MNKGTDKMQKTINLSSLQLNTTYHQ